MRLGLRLGVGAALALALFAGDTATLSLSTAPAVAAGHHGGYNGGYGHGGHYRRGYGGGFGLGDFLLGAAILGGTAAIISSANNPPYAYQTYPPVVYATPPAAPYGYADGAPQSPAYDAEPDAYPPQEQDAHIDPVEQCSRAAERQAQSRGGLARVAGIDRVDSGQNGARVSGRLEISDGGGNADRVDRIKFDCTATYGQITALRLS